VYVRDRAKGPHTKRLRTNQNGGQFASRKTEVVEGEPRDFPRRQMTPIACLLVSSGERRVGPGKMADLKREEGKRERRGTDKILSSQLVNAHWQKRRPGAYELRKSKGGHIPRGGTRKNKNRLDGASPLHGPWL